MIHPKEINAVAKKYKLKDTQIEKDYVLSWLLLGISRNPILSDSLVFKGGTLLKKVYFPDYRFSEDLDFTLLDYDIINEDLLAEFEKVYASFLAHRQQFVPEDFGYYDRSHFYKAVRQFTGRRIGESAIRESTIGESTIGETI